MMTVQERRVKDIACFFLQGNGNLVCTEQGSGNGREQPGKIEEGWIFQEPELEFYRADRVAGIVVKGLRHWLHCWYLGC